MPDRVVTQRLVLVSISHELATAVLVGDLSGVRAAAGWPLPATLGSLRMSAVDGLPAGWLVVLDGRVVGDCSAAGGDARCNLVAEHRDTGLEEEVLEAISSDPHRARLAIARA